MSRFIVTLILFVYFIHASVFAQTATPSTSPIVWTEDALTWVLKADPSKANSAITLYTAKREYEPFQVVVKAPASGNLTNVNVTVSDLVGPNSARIASSNINLYREYYVYTARGSSSNNGTNKPLGPGWYPDGLIPFADPATHQDLNGTLNGSPFTVAAGENQPVFIDIFTPPDAMAGQYTGTVTVTSTQGTKTIQLNLVVWNFTLPFIRSLHSYTQLDYTGILNTRSNYRELLVHRFNPVYVNRQDERFLMDNYGLDRVNAYAWSHSSYRHCTPIDPPPSISSVQAAAADHEPGLYLYDSYANEVWPCTAQFPIYMEWAKNLRAGGIHPDIVMYPVTALMGTAPDYQDSAGDVWTLLPKHYDQSKAQVGTLLSKGVEIWSYNPLVQDDYSPKQTIDYLPINSRIMHGFINQSLGFTGTKMWRVDYWSADPWNNKERYNSETGEQAPGDGDLTYRGDEVGLPGQVIAGMRLKWFREGSEDYEYIQILKNLGQTDFALSTTRRVGTDFHTWTKDKDVLLTARKQLGDKIHALSGSGACSRKPQGDADCDDKITLADFEIFRKEYLGAFTTINSDFNSNQKVDLADFEIFRKNYLLGT